LCKLLLSYKADTTVFVEQYRTRTRSTLIKSKDEFFRHDEGFGIST